MTYTCPDGSATLYYIYDGLQNVAALCNSNGAVMVQYSYDAWGKPTENFIGWPDGTVVTELDCYAASFNPFRYKGYFYDTETGLYYLNSRYYDPVTGRFINEDGQISVGQDFSGTNLFCYCGNNPINRIDTFGEAWWHWAIASAVVAVCVVATLATCGGFAAAATAVSAVASGVATTTAASTIAASALVASATVLN